MEEINKKLNNKESKDIPTIETYMSDMADAVRDQEASVTKIAVKEQKRRERGDYYKKGPQKKSNSKLWFVIGGIIFIAAAIFISHKLIQKKNEVNKPIPVVKVDSSPITYDSKITLDATNATTKSDLINLINPVLDQKGVPGTIKEIILNKNTTDGNKTLSLEDVLSLLNTSAPGSLLRSFKQNYMIGTYTPQNKYTPANLFLIIKIKDYDLAYAGMLSWEKTMVSDLFSLFHINISSDNNLLKIPFKDIILKNQNARVLYNKSGLGVLYYIFPNKNTLIISSSEEAINEITTRLLIKETKSIQ